MLTRIVGRRSYSYRTASVIWPVRRMANNGNANKKALIMIANGSEEIEAITAIDVLRRAGVDVSVGTLGTSLQCTLSRKVEVKADKSFADAKKDGLYDAILLPGGKGHEEFIESAELGAYLQEHDKAKKIVAAICAAPHAFRKHQIGEGKKITSYPSYKDKVMDGNKYEYSEDAVVVDGNMITSRGPGTATSWALTIASHLVGKETAQEVAKALLVPFP